MKLARTSERRNADVKSNWIKGGEDGRGRNERKKEIKMETIGKQLAVTYIFELIEVTIFFFPLERVWVSEGTPNSIYFNVCMWLNLRCVIRNTRQTVYVCLVGLLQFIRWDFTTWDRNEASVSRHRGGTIKGGWAWWNSYTQLYYWCSSCNRQKKSQPYMQSANNLKRNWMNWQEEEEISKMKHDRWQIDTILLNSLVYK